MEINREAPRSILKGPEKHKNRPVQWVSVVEVHTVQRLAKYSLEEEKQKANFLRENKASTKRRIPDIVAYLKTRKEPGFWNPDEFKSKKVPSFKLKDIQKDPTHPVQDVELKGDSEVVRGTRAIIEYAKKRKFILVEEPDLVLKN